jgi:uncharacterized protein involved in propanediol utilization
MKPSMPQLSTHKQPISWSPGVLQPAVDPESSRGSAEVVKGVGLAIGHHGEIFQGVVRTADGRLHRALCSLPCGGLRSEATFYPGTEGGALTVNPTWRKKALTAAQLALAHIGRPGLGGHLEVHSNTPPGWGLGSSTSDVTAALRAVFAALGSGQCQHSVARLAVKAEKACDSTIFNHAAVLFAHREGVVLEDLGGQIPGCEVLGFNTDPSGTGVDTLEFAPARYDSREINLLCDLLGDLRKAVREQNVHLLGHVATVCSRINQSHLPKPQFQQIEAVVRRVGAVGLQVAHSGTVVGMLFDSRSAATPGKISRAREELADLGFPQTWHFSTTQHELLSFD